MSEAEKQAEILPITVQQVYVYAQIGKFDEAEKLAATIPLTESVFTLVMYRFVAKSEQDQGIVNEMCCPNQRDSGFERAHQSVPITSPLSCISDPSKDG